jgi:uncharacterized phiE125 gp8 family phage protein
MAFELEVVKTQGMDLVVTSDSLPIPITLSVVKEHLNIDFNDEDDKLTALLASAFREVELFIECGLKTKTVRLSYTQINGTVLLPYAPIQSITSVTDFDGTALVFDKDYSLSGEKTKLSAYNGGGIKITYIAGFTSLPKDIENAILDIIAVDFDNKVEDKRLALKAIKDRIRHYRPVYV